MQLLKQKGNTCTLYALAMVICKSVDEIVERLGHNGTEMLDGHPFGIHPQEIIDLGYTCGWMVIMIEKWPMNRWPPRKVAWEIWPESHAEARFAYHLMDSTGIIFSDRHAVAWDGHMVYDPKGKTYGIEEFNASHYLKFIKFVGYPDLPRITESEMRAHKESLSTR